MNSLILEYKDYIKSINEGFFTYDNIPPNNIKTII
jgi:hypothetical protein